MTAFQEGWAAAEQGQPINTNPYHGWSGSYSLWRNGWKAMLESMIRTYA